MTKGKDGAVIGYKQIHNLELQIRAHTKTRVVQPITALSLPVITKPLDGMSPDDSVDDSPVVDSSRKSPSPKYFHSEPRAASEYKSSELALY
jgi:hypothetical protein